MFWKKKIGDFVVCDEILVDIEIDKVVFEVLLLGVGVLVEIVKGDGDIVVFGELIVCIDIEVKVGVMVFVVEVLKVVALVVVLVIFVVVLVGMVSLLVCKIFDEKGVVVVDVFGLGCGGCVIKEDVVVV